MSYMETIGYLCEKAYTTSREHGFWDILDIAGSKSEIEPTILLSKIALVMSELGEAVEAIREDSYGNLEEELADVCIRVFDIAGYLRLDLEGSISAKMDKNENRPHMHGKRA